MQTPVEEINERANWRNSRCWEAGYKLHMAKSGGEPWINRVLRLCKMRQSTVKNWCVRGCEWVKWRWVIKSLMASPSGRHHSLSDVLQYIYIYYIWTSFQRRADPWEVGTTIYIYTYTHFCLEISLQEHERSSKGAIGGQSASAGLFSAGALVKVLCQHWKPVDSAVVPESGSWSCLCCPLLSV